MKHKWTRVTSPEAVVVQLLVAVWIIARVDLASANGQTQGSKMQRVPIGMLVSLDADYIQDVFMFETEKHNSNATVSVRLEPYQGRVDLADSFNVSKTVCSLISNGLFALFGVANETSRSALDAITRTFRMPFVTTSVPINSLPPLTSLSSSSSSGGGSKSASVSVNKPLPPPSTSTSSGGLGAGVGPSLSPWLQSSPPLSSVADFTVYMRPTYDRALVDVIRYYKWQNVSYVYDSNDGLARLENLYSIVNSNKHGEQETSLVVDAIRLVDVSHSYMTLRQLDSRWSSVNKFIVLDLSTEDAIHSILKQIQAVGMNRAGYHYLIGSLSFDELDLNDFVHGGVNITGFTLIDNTSAEAQSFKREIMAYNFKRQRGAAIRRINIETALTVDAVSVMFHGLGTLLSDQERERFRTTFKQGHVYNNGTRGVHCRSDPPIPWVHGVDIYKSLIAVQFTGVSGHVAFDQRGHRKNYRLAVHELNLDNPPKKIGTWDYSTGLNMQVTKEDTSIKLPANKTRYIVTTIISAPYLTRRVLKPDEATPTDKNDLFEGYCADLIHLIKDRLNKRGILFDYELRLVGDDKYGAKEPDGTWNGMVGELTQRIADLAVAPLTISAVRERVIDFTKPFMQLGISIMIKKPEKQKPGVFSFMDPLSYKIWMCIVISYISVSFVLFLVSRFSPFEWQIEDNENGPTFTNDFTMLNSLWFSLGALMRQGVDISPRSLSGRIVGSAWWFFTLIIISSYTANLAAFLTVERMLTPIESADDLAKQREIQYGTLRSGSTNDFFKNSKIHVYERMWDFMYNNPGVFVDKTEEGIARVRNSKGKYAFLLESTMNDYYNQRKPCNTMKVGDNLDSKGYGIATPIGSPLREPIGLIVLELLEKGDLQKLHKKWWFDKGECVPEDSKGGSSQSALTLSNVAGIFYILIGGLGLSMVVSLLEYMYKSKKSIIKTKKTFNDSSRSKASQSLTLSSDRENGGYTYTAPTQVSGLDSYTASIADIKNTHTQV